MRIRGERECAACGRQWSYYETGSVSCPACGSIRSVGRDDERRPHTDGPAALDLTEARSLVDSQPIGAVADAAEEAAREYRRKRGFLRGGDLQPLDDRYVAAVELRHAAAAVKRNRDQDDDLHGYFYALLAGADTGERPPADHIPPGTRWPRGLTAATIVEDYRRDVSAWLEDHPTPAMREVSDALDQQATRVAALDGDVPAQEADRLIAIAQDLGTFLTEGDEGSLTRAEDRLLRLQ